jgi:hypothetical protein
LNFKGSFDEFINAHEGVLSRGYYGEQLTRYLQLFRQEQFLILIFEEAVSHYRATAEKLATFLNIDPEGFDVARMNERVNASYLPRMPRLYTSAVKLRNCLVKRNLARILTSAEEIGLIQAIRWVVRFRGPRSELPVIDGGTRSYLRDLYSQEVDNLEILLGRDLSIWRN